MHLLHQELYFEVPSTFLPDALKANKDFVTPQFVQCFSVFSTFAQAGDLAIISLLNFDQLLFAKQEISFFPRGSHIVN